MKRLISLTSVLSMLFSMASFANGVSIAPNLGTDELPIMTETVKGNGDRILTFKNSDGTVDTAYIPLEGDFYYFNGEKINASDIVTITVKEYYDPVMASKNSEPNWLYIRTTEYDADFQEQFFTFTVSGLAALISKYFPQAKDVAPKIASVLIDAYGSYDHLDLTRTTYGNAYQLNHYKHDDLYHIDGTEVYTRTWYNPPVYS